MGWTLITEPFEKGDVKAALKDAAFDSERKRSHKATGDQLKLAEKVIGEAIASGAIGGDRFIAVAHGHANDSHKAVDVEAGLGETITVTVQTAPLEPEGDEDAEGQTESEGDAGEAATGDPEGPTLSPSTPPPDLQ